MLNLACFFHLNLMYSSIPTDQRPEVIRRCYHRLLALASQQRPLSLEATVLTLEMIHELDPNWLEQLQSKISDGAVEFVGSGYSQIIAPLVPARVNQANLRLGRQGYEDLLGFNPRLWLINEMAYSGGLPSLYREVGAQSLVMEWNNAWKGHPRWDPELRYHYQLALGCDDTSLPVIWIDTLDFQIFQRMAHDEMDTRQWLEVWTQRADQASSRLRQAAVYGSDAEVFDFRPGRFSGEGQPDPRGEWRRIEEALKQLGQHPGLRWQTLGAALDEEPSRVCGQPLQLESSEQPVVVKKQEKYNLNRWAVTGRGDLEANTACFRSLADLAPDPSPEQWRQLLWRWSSDFRTHITANRWREFQGFNLASGPHPEPAGSADGQTVPLDTDQRKVELTTRHATVTLDLRRGLALRTVTFPLLGDKPALGTLPHGYFDDISFGADFYSGHTVVQHPGERKLTDLQDCTATTNIIQKEDGSLIASAEISDGELVVHKQVEVSGTRPEIILTGQLQLPSRRAGQIHPLHLTVIPGLLDQGHLEYHTHNGGLAQEVFPLTEEGVFHGASYSTLVTAKGGLGATEGIIEIGDGRHSLLIQHDPTVSALMPTLRFEQVRGGDYFLRLRYSAQEIDETFVPNDAPWQVTWRITVKAI